MENSRQMEMRKPATMMAGGTAHFRDESNDPA
jgi:hypothetical protein